MKIITTVLAVTVLLLTAQTSEAHPHGRLDKKQYNQHQRIRNGVQNGSLTHREARALRAQQRQVTAMKRVAKADGVVTRSERAIINNAQRKANRNIYNKKHDARQRYCR